MAGLQVNLPSKIRRNGSESGFTLIELAIVLVVIGLLVGGVLVGQDLIKASQVRATVTQLEKYNSATNAFFSKYGFLPGDLPAAPAAQFGFVARGQYAGEGDGNGLIEGIGVNAPGNNLGVRQGAGETPVFWVDLSTANMIDGGFSVASENYVPGAGVILANLPQYFPSAKLGQGNIFYVYSYNTNNYFGISVPTLIDGAAGLYSVPGLTVKQAYAIDAKIDDGIPQSGRVLAYFINTSCTWNAPSWPPSEPYSCNYPHRLHGCHSRDFQHML